MVMLRVVPVMLTKEMSQRLDVLRFPLIVGVVFAHAYIKSDADIILGFFYNFISHGLVRITVPIFFLLSGYLFFINIDSAKATYLKKIKTRIKTLFIPFLFWNLITLAIFAFAQSMASTKIFFSGANSSIASYDLLDYLNAIFGFDRMPIAMHFWFIRDLIILILLSPVIYFANTRIPMLFLSFLLICWLINYWPIYIPSGEGTLYFSFGAFWGQSKYSLFALDKYGKLFGLVYLIILTVTAAYFESSFTVYLHKIGIILGIVYAFFITKYTISITTFKDTLLELGERSFFIYAAHEPLQLVVRKLVYSALCPEAWGAILVLYFAIPIGVIMTLIFTYEGLKKVMPNVLLLITGGRSK